MPSLPPLVSVVVPIYKTEKFVEKCLRSLQTQTFADFEVICVDDGSPDDAGKIAREFARSDARFRLITHETNRGLGAARNTAIRASSAEYIASVDSDDYVASDFLARLVDGADGGRFDVVCCGFARVDENGRVLSHHVQRVEKFDPQATSFDPFGHVNPAFWNKLWLRSLFVDNDIWFPDRENYQDMATTPRILSKARYLRTIGGDSYRYLVRPDAITMGISDKHLMDFLRVFDVLKDHLIASGDYGRLGGALRKRINTAIEHHLSNVHARATFSSDENLQQYARHLKIVWAGYQVFDDRIRGGANTASLAKETSRAMAKFLGPTKPLRAKWNGFDPRILVLTLYSGENEYESMMDSLVEQTVTNWKQVLIAGKPNAEAHRELYETIMRRSSEFDLFVKVDADMVLAHEYVLERVVEEFRSHPDMDHLIVHCLDFMTGKDIIGVHAYSNRVRWEASEEGLFLDPSPKRPGRRIILDPDGVLFFHSPNPGALQAFHFGVHRALKVTQRDRPASTRKIEGMEVQWATLSDVWARYQSDGDRRHGLALLGADAVFAGRLSNDAHNYENDALAAAFAKTEPMSDDDIRDVLTRKWGGWLRRHMYLLRSVGPRAAYELFKRKRTLRQRVNGTMTQTHGRSHRQMLSA